jgi:cytochrome P450
MAARLWIGSLMPQRDELQVLQDLMNSQGPVFRRHGNKVYVGDPVLAKEVLANRPARYREHSDFFRTKHGVFGPRAVQVAIGRGMRTLLECHLDDHLAGLPDLIERNLAPISHWPHAANHLLYAQFGPALLGPATPEQVSRLTEQVVLRAVLAGARERYSVPSRIVFRRKVMRALTSEIIARRSAKGDPIDILGVIIQAAPPTADASQLSEVFLSCLFAVIGAVGFLVAWSVFLLGTSPHETGTAPSLIVREALRLWPVAWLFARRPTIPHELADIAVTPQDYVLACNYLVQRNPSSWEEPNEFCPQRWIAGGSNNAYIPFGWGPHSCIGAVLAVQFAERVITELALGYHIKITTLGSRPHVDAALAPPEFTTHLIPRMR